MENRHPFQEIYSDDSGVIRFRENVIIRQLVDDGKIDLNDIAVRGFPQDDCEQFYQLIGYCLKGFHELNDVSDETAKEASQHARESLRLNPGNPVGCRDGGCKIHCGVPRT
jgi:hypothetical protein